MFRYTEMAEEVRGSFKGGDIDGHIAKFASDRKLNVDQHQRVIEEVNVGSFLDKLKDGTHHEDFPVASTIQSANGHGNLDKVANDSGCSPLEKAASVNYSDLIDDSMFQMGTMELDDTMAADTLSKVASMYDVNMDAAQNEWESNDNLAKIASNGRDREKEMLEAGDERADSVISLTKIASESDDIAKSVIVAMATNGLAKEAEDVLENIKFSTSEIEDAVITHVPSEALAEIEKLAKVHFAGAGEVLKDAGSVAKEIAGAGKHVAKGAYGLAKFPVKHPKTTALGIVSAVTAKKMNDNTQADDERLRQSAFASGAQ